MSVFKITRKFIALKILSQCFTSYHQKYKNARKNINKSMMADDTKNEKKHNRITAVVINKISTN